MSLVCSSQYPECMQACLLVYTHTCLHMCTHKYTPVHGPPIPLPRAVPLTPDFRRLWFIVPRDKPGQMGKYSSVADSSSVRETTLLRLFGLGLLWKGFLSLRGVKPGQCPQIWPHTSRFKCRFPGPLQAYEVRAQSVRKGFVFLASLPGQSEGAGPETGIWIRLLFPKAKIAFVLFDNDNSKRSRNCAKL